MNKKYIARNNQLNSARHFINKLSRLGGDELFHLIGLNFNENNHTDMQLVKDVKKMLGEYDIPASMRPATWKCAICNEELVDYGKNCEACIAKNKGIKNGDSKGLGISEIANMD